MIGHHLPLCSLYSDSVLSCSQAPDSISNDPDPVLLTKSAVLGGRDSLSGFARLTPATHLAGTVPFPGFDGN